MVTDVLVAPATLDPAPGGVEKVRTDPDRS
ncbi:hypothetical protein SAMN04488543_3622 [Friedmanniella luteola]|uniref:Uncharacterized protein n=1 Tax=Friedmanniella luteola TaxID=546871 RepID=A0A1H1Z8V6_9ACTN|nr:hypothetical protein SAMN04488543_3622 [Friedmanniella luteola]